MLFDTPSSEVVIYSSQKSPTSAKDGQKRTTQSSPRVDQEGEPTAQVSIAKSETTEQLAEAEKKFRAPD